VFLSCVFVVVMRQALFQIKILIFLRGWFAHASYMEPHSLVVAPYLFNQQILIGRKIRERNLIKRKRRINRFPLIQLLHLLLLRMPLRRHAVKKKKIWMTFLPRWNDPCTHNVIDRVDLTRNLEKKINIINFVIIYSSI
jgi:hypothetical protein